MESADKPKKTPAEKKVSRAKISKGSEKAAASDGAAGKKAAKDKAPLDKAVSDNAAPDTTAPDTVAHDMASSGKETAGKANVGTASAAKAVKAQKPENVVVELAKKGESPSRIGIILRDQHGVGSVKEATGKKMGKLLKENEFTGDLPEDLGNLMKRRSMLIKHNEMNRGDKCGKRGQQLAEARIVRLSKYYKKKGLLPKDWKYKKSEAVKQW